MKRRRVITTALVTGFAGLIMFLSAFSSRASAAGLDDFVLMLRSGGLQATSAGALQHAGLSLGGQEIFVTQGTSHTQVQLFDYPSPAAMLRDWQVEPGRPVTPLVPATDLSGHLAMKNGSRILVFDDVIVTGDQTAAGDSIVRSVGQAFLSLPSAPNGDGAVAAPASIGLSLSPPHTGDGSLATNHRPLPLWAGLLWTGLTASAIVFGAAGALVLLMKTRRLA